MPVFATTRRGSKQFRKCCISPFVMATGGETPPTADRPAEVVVLECKFDYLVKSIDAASVLPAALSARLITAQQRAACWVECDPYNRAEKFLGHLQRTVNGNLEKFHTFLQVLDGTGQESIAKHLRGA